MQSRRIHLKRRLVMVAGLAALLGLASAAGSSAASATRQVQVLDDCDPATFNAAIGPGTCV
jgi:plastocyanin